MSRGQEPEDVVYDGDHYCWFDEEVWKWNFEAQVWEALDYQPEFLVVVNDKLALTAETGKHYCNCPIRTLMCRGCLCGGV